jgi:hypothetical protein
MTEQRTSPGDVIDARAIREHRIDQIEPESTVTRPESLLSDWDLHLFAEGTHNKLWHKLGSHLVPGGTRFAVWAPNAERVSGGASAAAAQRHGNLGRLHPRGGARNRVQVPHRLAPQRLSHR